MDEDDTEGATSSDRGWVLVRRLAPMPYEVQFATFLFTGPQPDTAEIYPSQS